MEELLGKLRDNFGLIAFLVLALGSQLWKFVRSGAGPNDQPGKGRSHPMPSFGGDPGEIKQDPRSEDRSLRERNMDRQSSERERAYRERVGSQGHSDEAGQAGSVSKVITLEKEELARAVMWSEILGPPRSKRPYRRT